MRIESDMASSNNTWIALDLIWILNFLVLYNGELHMITWSIFHSQWPQQISESFCNAAVAGTVKFEKSFPRIGPTDLSHSSRESLQWWVIWDGERASLELKAVIEFSPKTFDFVIDIHVIGFQKTSKSLTRIYLDPCFLGQASSIDRCKRVGQAARLIFEAGFRLRCLIRSSSPELYSSRSKFGGN